MKKKKKARSVYVAVKGSKNGKDWVHLFEPEQPEQYPQIIQIDLEFCPLRYLTIQQVKK